MSQEDRSSTIRLASACRAALKAARERGCDCDPTVAVERIKNGVPVVGVTHREDCASVLAWDARERAS